MSTSPADSVTTAPGLRPAGTRPYPLDRLAAALGAHLRPRVPGRSHVADVADVAVTGVAFDSRAVRPGDLYIGLPGAHTHGAGFTRQALRAGAAAVLTDPAGADLVDAGTDGSDGSVPVLLVDDPRQAMAVAAAEVYGRPATRLAMIGVTGTNGKTTTSYLLAAGLRAAGRSCGLIGTLGYFLDGEEIAGDRTTVTTPESADLQALLAIMVERGAEAVVMEVSSHALSLGRVDEITFDVAGFTNFGRDHLDFHGSLEAYFEAKAQLFSAGRARRAVINLDDARGPELVRRATDAGLDVATTSLAAAAADADAGHGPAARSHDQYRCLDHDPTADPVRVRIGTPQGELDFRLGLPGRFNVANAITALAMLDRIHVDLAAAAQGLATASVPGRLERIELGTAAPRAYVDFAHTPQAIGSVLAELRAGVGDGRLIAVLGCGGDRDPAKRGPMGAVAAQLADVVIITDDNPRSEDPADIRAAALAGAREQAAGADRPVTVLDGGDRAAAIRRALVIAGPADVVAVLGKGHERGQEIDGQVLPFDDAQQLRSAWQQSGTTPSQQTDQPEGGRP